MRRLSDLGRVRLIAFAALLSACQMTLPGRVADAPPPNPITGGPITVTPLDEPTATPVAAEPARAAPEANPEPPADPAPVDPAPAVNAAPPRSLAQIACEKGRGLWVTVGAAGTKSCQTPLRDSGKQCTRDRDCEGECLARSRTCAPFTPLFGCNEVLQDNGQRVTICID